MVAILHGGKLGGGEVWDMKMMGRNRGVIMMGVLC